MKIAFIITNVVFSQSNGVRSQALTWKMGLEKLGHEVTLVNNWNPISWKEYDVIHCFSIDESMYVFLKYITQVNKNVVLSPIIDPNAPLFLYKIISYCGSSTFHYSNKYWYLRKSQPHISKILARSEFEKNLLINTFGYKESQVFVVPLACTIWNKDSHAVDRENSCFHLSLLADNRKNVRRLIEAAKKYNFKLILGGKLRNEKEKEILDSWIGNNMNIEYKGFLSDKQLEYYYSHCKVFALPSIYEGVGIVALDAAASGCDIVITNIGGPKEYYHGLAIEVSPYSVDEIGKAVTRFMKGESYQPELQKKVQEMYNIEIIINTLIALYKV